MVKNKLLRKILDKTKSTLQTAGDFTLDVGRPLTDSKFMRGLNKITGGYVGGADQYKSELDKEVKSYENLSNLQDKLIKRIKK